jgi:hypothetical protein
MTDALQSASVFIWRYCMTDRPKAAPRARRKPRRRSPQDERVALVTRMMRAAEMQVSEIEQRLARPQPEFAERERDARLMAVLVKTVRELTALDALHDDASTTAETDEDDVPANIDELRRELSRRVSELRERPDGRGSGEP